MMQLNFNFTPTCVTMFRQTVNQSFIVFLSRIKICVPQGLAFVVSPSVNRSRILSTPSF
jgi:hypothetical protein